MYLLQYCALNGNGWNEWHTNTILGFVETIEQGKEYAIRHYPKVPFIENENETYYGDYILLTKVELLGGKK